MFLFETWLTIELTQGRPSKARYNNKEYVITQPFDKNMFFSDVWEVLLTELKLLAQCDGIKEKFNEFIKEGDVKGVPGMFLNTIY